MKPHTHLHLASVGLLLAALLTACQAPHPDRGFRLWGNSFEKTCLGESKRHIRQRFEGLEECYFRIAEMDCQTYMGQRRYGASEVDADLYFHFAPDGLARIDAHYEFAAQYTPARTGLNHDIFRRHGTHKPAHTSTWGYEDQHTRLTYHLSEAPLHPGYVQSSFSWGYHAAYPAE